MQLVPTRHPSRPAGSREPGPCKPQGAAEVGKGLFAPLLTSFAQTCGHAGIFHPACTLGSMQKPKQTTPCNLLLSKFGRVWGKNSQGAVSHRGHLWQSWSPCLSPAGSATLTPHSKGSVFGFAWRNSPQARRGEEPACGAYLLQTASNTLQNRGKTPGLSTRHPDANLTLPKPVPTSHSGMAGNLQLGSAQGSSSFAQCFGLSLNFNTDFRELHLSLIESAGARQPWLQWGSVP